MASRAKVLAALIHAPYKAVQKAQSHYAIEKFHSWFAFNALSNLAAVSNC